MKNEITGEICNGSYIPNKQILIFVYKSLNSLLPHHCTNYFIETKHIGLHSHATRGHETNLYLAQARKVCRRNSIIGPKYWKLLPNFIKKTASSLNIFKNRLNKYLHANPWT